MWDTAGGVSRPYVGGPDIRLRMAAESEAEGRVDQGRRGGCPTACLGVLYEYRAITGGNSRSPYHSLV